jgi:hypothetical protein
VIAEYVESDLNFDSENTILGFSWAEALMDHVIVLVDSDFLDRRFFSMSCRLMLYRGRLARPPEVQPEHFRYHAAQTLRLALSMGIRSSRTVSSLNTELVQHLLKIIDRYRALVTETVWLADFREPLQDFFASFFGWKDTNELEVKLKDEAVELHIVLRSLCHYMSQHWNDSDPSSAADSVSALPVGWEERSTPEGRSYYVNYEMQTTTWLRPRQQTVMREENAAVQLQADANPTAVDTSGAGAPAADPSTVIPSAHGDPTVNALDVSITTLNISAEDPLTIADTSAKDLTVMGVATNAESPLDPNLFKKFKLKAVQPCNWNTDRCARLCPAPCAR